MSGKQTTHTGWIILAPMGKDFNGKRVWIPETHPITYPAPVMYPTKAEAMKYRLRGKKVVRATVTTEWEDIA